MLVVVSFLHIFISSAKTALHTVMKHGYENSYVVSEVTVQI